MKKRGILLAALLVIGLALLWPDALAQTPPEFGPGDIGSGEFRFDLGAITHEDIRESNWINRGINFVFERVIAIMAGTIGSVAVLMMSVGGFLMLSAGADQQRYDKGKQYVTYSLLGIVFVLGAYVIVTAVQLLVKAIYG